MEDNKKIKEIVEALKSGDTNTVIEILKAKDPWIVGFACGFKAALVLESDCYNKLGSCECKCNKCKESKNMAIDDDSDDDSDDDWDDDEDEDWDEDDDEEDCDDILSCGDQINKVLEEFNPKNSSPKKVAEKIAKILGVDVENIVVCGVGCIPEGNPKWLKKLKK